MAELDPLGTALLLFFLITLATVALFLALKLLKSGKLYRALQAREEAAAQEDRAHNALVTSEAIVRQLEERGLESTRAASLLQEARQAYYEGHRGEAEALASEARTVLLEVLRQDEAAGPLSALEAELAELPEEKPVLGREYPRNYLQAKFLLGLVQGRLRETKKGSPEGKRVRRLVRESQAAFEEERYTEALALAVSARRILDGDEEEAREEKEEAAGDEDDRDRCPDCASAVGPGDEFCGKCGLPLRRPRACPECETPVGTDDNFCRQCGTSLQAVSAAR